MSQTVNSILKTFPQTIDVAVMFSIISVLSAFIGHKFLDPDTPSITVSNFIKLIRL